MLKDLKKTHPNMYALYASLLLALWFNGFANLLNNFFPVKGFALSLLLMLIPLVLFLWDDGTLDELYKIENNLIPAATSSSSITQPYPRNIDNFIEIHKKIN